MSEALELYSKICDSGWLRDRRATTRKAVKNTFSGYTTNEVIPANTEMTCDHAGDYGMYATADIDGVLKRIKIDLSDLHTIEFNHKPIRIVTKFNKKLLGIAKNLYIIP